MIQRKTSKDPETWKAEVYRWDGVYRIQSIMRNRTVYVAGQ